MKKYVLFLLVFIVFVSSSTIAQLKIGYVDSDAIMKEMPDYQDVQKKLDSMIKEWQEEITKMEKEWKTKYEDYENKKLIMSDQKRIEAEKELSKLEEQIFNYRQEKLGFKGEYFRKQEELMKPLHNKIFNVILDIAKEKDLDFVFDRSGDILFLYAKEEYDITPLVLEKLK